MNAMSWYTQFRERVMDFRMPAWEELPDLGLYMDQVITYLQRLYLPIYGEGRRIITPAMINNYVKSGLIHRPKGKKYSREQIAQLVILCALKQALSLEDLRLLIQSEGEENIEAVYRTFIRQSLQMTQGMGEEIQAMSPMECAVQAATYTILCAEILHAEA